MNSTRIIPAIDVIAGKCVRLKEGDFQRKTVYSDDPLRIAQAYEQAGISHLHLVDLDGAKAGRVVNLKLIESICKKTHLKVDVGGGIKTEDDVKNVFDAGANQINVGSLAVKEPEKVLLWMSTFGSDKIILSADVRDGKIAIHGWQTLTDIHLFDFVDEYLRQGITSVVCTDISRDGMLAGPSIALYRSLLDAFPAMDLVASGGVSSIEDVNELKQLGVGGIIIGKALYEGKILLKDLIYAD